MNDDPDCRNQLEEILEFCNAIIGRIEHYHIDEKSIAANSDHADLILMPLCQIGETVQRSRDALEARYPDVPWHKMAGLRNVIVHGYTNVDAATVYATAMHDIPQLKTFCENNL